MPRVGVRRHRVELYSGRNVSVVSLSSCGTESYSWLLTVSTRLLPAHRAHHLFQERSYPLHSSRSVVHQGYIAVGQPTLRCSNRSYSVGLQALRL